MSQCDTCKKTAYCDIFRDTMDYENDPECLPNGKTWNCKWYERSKYAGKE